MIAIEAYGTRLEPHVEQALPNLCAASLAMACLADELMKSIGPHHE